jgi:phospholipase/carboxylesterase
LTWFYKRGNPPTEGLGAASEMKSTLAFIHRFEKGTNEKAHPVLLLHGTGGSENYLLPLGRIVAPNAPLLSPRGKVLENSMPRFFRRFAEGVLDEDDVRRRANELADFVSEARNHYGILSPIVLGYSNGANMAVAMLLLRPEALAGAILLRPAMIPLSQVPSNDLAGKPILIISGASDPTISAERFSELLSLLQQRTGSVEHRTIRIGHEISPIDGTLARNWLQAHSLT